MKFAVSNIALTSYSHEAELAKLRELDLEGIEVAPSRVWEETWTGLRAKQVSEYRKLVETSSLKVVGLHSLLFDHPELELFGTPDQERDLFDFFVHLSGVCRDLGGRTLIWGGGRRRGAVDPAEATARTIEFFSMLAHEIEPHGTCFCIEPLGPRDTDFVHSVLDSLAIVKAVDHPSLRVQIDAKALYDNNEFGIDPFQAASSLLVHFHANEPGLEILGTSGKIDHAAAGSHLRKVGYDQYVSIEQKLIGPENPLAAIEQSVSVLKEAYA